MGKPKKIPDSERIVLQVMKEVEREKVPPAEILGFVLDSLSDDELFMLNSDDSMRGAALFAALIRPLWEGRTDRSFEAEQPEVTGWTQAMSWELLCEELLRAGLAKRKLMPTDTAHLFGDELNDLQVRVTGKNEVLPRLSRPAKKFLPRLFG